MKERPILFSAPMVRALLAGTKTQTRRVVKPAPQTVRNHRSAAWDGDPAELMKLLTTAGRRCPYGQPGDRLWCRETWLTVNGDDTFYRADYLHDPAGDRAHGVAWKPSIHMHRSRSRITLEVTGVRVERLQDISEADALAEGVTPLPGGDMWTAGGLYDGPLHAARPQWAYRRLWEQINGPESWAANPWVWVVEFRRLEAAC